MWSSSIGGMSAAIDSSVTTLLRTVWRAGSAGRARAGTDAIGRRLRLVPNDERPELMLRLGVVRETKLLDKAGSLELYAECPFKYYARHVLKLEEDAADDDERPPDDHDPRSRPDMCVPAEFVDHLRERASHLVDRTAGRRGDRTHELVVIDWGVVGGRRGDEVRGQGRREGAARDHDDRDHPPRGVAHRPTHQQQHEDHHRPDQGDETGEIQEQDFIANRSEFDSGFGDFGQFHREETVWEVHGDERGEENDHHRDADPGN